MKVKEMKSGDKVEQPLLVSSMTEGITSSGSPYLNLAFQDASGVIDAKLWDVKPQQKELRRFG